MHQDLKILVIGAGGLGCELLKNLALIGIRDIHVIDMDTIETSNLNRQFLFRHKDVGRPKAEVAADFINERVVGVKVTPHFAKIQDKDEDFYKGFHLVVCGLDSIVARRWINAMMVSLVEYDEEGVLDPASARFFVEGGTEGFKGNARVIRAGVSACVECTLDLYPPQVDFPMCTIAHTPRLPEHCIEYAKVLLWPEQKPFGDEPVDGDNPAHIEWLFTKAKERAESHQITGVTYRLTQGVVKHIIPAVASTNAVIAAACTTEVLKLATSCGKPLENYLTFNDGTGVYTYTFEAEKQEDCLVCSNIPQTLRFSEETLLQEVVDYLKDNPKYQMKGPGIRAMLGGKLRTLIMQSAALFEATKPNLKKSLTDLGIGDGQELMVTDPTSPTTMIFRVVLATGMQS